MFDEQILQSILIKLHSSNFYDTKQILDSLQGILLDENLRSEEISYCNSKIFNQENSLFKYIKKHIDQKDQLHANMRKGIYKILAKYIKMRGHLIMEYITTIYDECIVFFKQDDSNTAKQASLKPIIKILQYIQSKEIVEQNLKPEQLADILLREIRQSRPVATVKGTIWHLLGVITKEFGQCLSQDVKREIQEVCLLQLKQELKSSKPETNVIVGAFKSFRFSLSNNQLNVKEQKELYNFMVAGITEIKDLKVYKVINSALRLLEEQAQQFSVQILESPQRVFDLTMNLINHKNKTVKENACQSLESFMNVISLALDQANQQDQAFRYIMTKMYALVKEQETYTDVHSVTVIIKAVGIFSTAINKILGEEQLHIFFDKLIKISEEKILRVFEMSDQQYKSEFSSADDIYQGGQGFKTVLYRQKQLNGFLQSFANIVRNLKIITDKEAQHLFQLALLGIKQHQVMFIKYKDCLYNSIVQLLMALKVHQKIYILWMKKLIADGLVESLKMPDTLNLNMEDYYESLRNTSNFWLNIFNRPNLWTENTLVTFSDCFFGYFNELLQKSDLSYVIVYQNQIKPSDETIQEQGMGKENDYLQTQVQDEDDDEYDEEAFDLQQQPQKKKNKMEIEDTQNQETEEQKLKNIQNLLKDQQTIQYLPSNMDEMQYFYRVVLLLDYIISRINQNILKQWIPIIYKNTIAKLRQLPRSIFLLKLLKTLNIFIQKSNILRNLRSKEKYELVLLMKHFFSDLFDQQRKYQDELLQDALKVILTVPQEIVMAENYKFFKHQLIISLKRAFELGEQHISLGYCALQQLNRYVNIGKQKIINKYLVLIIPSLSDYLLLDQKSKEIQEQNKTSINLEKAEMFNETLDELKITRVDLVHKVQEFLGSIGGQAHLIVPSEGQKQEIQINQSLVKELENFQKKQKSLIAWDYEISVNFPLPFASKKIDLNITKLLPRILEIAQNHVENKLKVYACELSHALVIYMIGKTAQKSEINERREKRQDLKTKEKQNYSQIYEKIFPVLFKIGSDTAHPSHKLINTLCFQVIRWFGHAKQPESPEILGLLECLIDSISSKDNNNLREFASKGIGELVKWTIKSKTDKEIESQKGNIKATFRKIQSLASHPDSYKRYGALLAIKENLKHIASNKYLLNHYILDLAYTTLNISKITGFTGEMVEIYYYMIDKISKIIVKHSLSLGQLLKRSGIHQSLNEFVDFLYDYCIFAKEENVRKGGFILLYNIKSSNFKKFLIDKSVNRESLFGEKIESIKFSNNDIIQKQIILTTQSQVFRKLIVPLKQNDNESIFVTDDLVNFTDFEIYIKNLKKFFKFLISSKDQKDQPTSSLIDIMYSTNLEHQSNESGYVCTEQQAQYIFVSFKMILKLLIVFDVEIIQWILLEELNFQEKTDLILSTIIHFVLRPNQFFFSLDLQKVLNDQEYYNIVSQFLNKLIIIYKTFNKQNTADQFYDNVVQLGFQNCIENYKKNSAESLEEILIDNEIIKESEIKVFIKSLSIIFQSVIGQSNKSTMQVQLLVKNIFQWIQQYEEQRFINIKLLSSDDQEKQNLMVIEEENNQQTQQKVQSYERVKLLLEFILDLSTTNTDKFVLESLNQQSIIFQKYEENLLNYLNKRWIKVSQEFFKNAATNLSLLKLLIPIIQRFFQSKNNENILQILEDIIYLEQDIDRTVQTYLSLELKVNCLLLSQTNKDSLNDGYHLYVQNLIKQGLNEQLLMTIHQETIQLTGLYISKLQKKNQFQKFYDLEVKDLVEGIRSKYFPSRISNLERNSKEEIAFKLIFESMVNMAQIAGKIELFQLFFPILRENVNDYRTKKIDKFIKQFLRENFVNKDAELQGEQIHFIMKNFLDDNIDIDLEENIRFKLVKKILIFMVENARFQIIVDVMGGLNDRRFFEQFLMRKNIQEAKSSCDKLLQIQKLECIMLILNSVYKKLPLNIIKDQMHPTMYGKDSKKNELTKIIITQSENILHYGLEDHDQLLEAQKLGEADLIGIDIKGILRKFYCSTFNLLANVMMKTQTKAKLFDQYLFVKKDRKLWDLLVDLDQENFKFEDEELEEVYIQKLENLVQQRQITTTQQLQSRYYKETLLYSQSEVQQRNTFLNDNNFQQQNNLNNNQEQQIKKQEILGTILELEEENTQYYDDLNQDQELQDENSDTIKFQQPKQKLELDIINKHESMRTIIHLMDFMMDTFEVKDTLWQQYLYEVLSKEDLPLAVHVFLLKFILNRSQYFVHNAELWFPILLKYASLAKNGGVGFHYYLRDTITVSMDWLDVKENRLIDKKNDSAQKKQLYCKCVNNLIAKLANPDIKIFNQNHTILYNLLNFFQEMVYIDEVKVLKMLQIDDTKIVDKQKKSEMQLWKINSVKVLNSCLILRIPLLKNYQEFSQSQLDNISKYKFWKNANEQLTAKRLHKTLIHIILHFKKDFAKDAAVLYGQMFKFLKQMGLFQEVRQHTEDEIIIDLIAMRENNDKSIKDRFSSMLGSLSYTYPYILLNRKLFLNCCDIIGRYQKKDRAQALKSFIILLKMDIELPKIETKIQDISRTLEVHCEKIVQDSDHSNQREFLELLLVLSQENMLSIREVRNLFEHKFKVIQKQYQRNSNDMFAERYYNIVLSLNNYYVTEQKLKEEGKDLNIEDNNNSIEDNSNQQFLVILKAALLTGLTSQHRSIRKKIFMFLDNEAINTDSPFDKLLYLIQEIYSPEEEDLWLISAIPLLLSLSKKSSDYSRELYEEPLDNLAQFYDWDFRDPLYQKRFNNSQPMTPFFTQGQSQLMSQGGFQIPRSKPLYTQMSQINMQQGYIRNTQNQNSLFTQTQNQQVNFGSQNPNFSQSQEENQSGSFSTSLVEPTAYQKKYEKLQKQTQLQQESISANNKKQLKGLNQYEEQNQKQVQSSLDDENISGRKKNQGLQQFFSQNNMTFQTVFIRNNRIRYTADNSQGKTIMSSQDIQKRQAEIYFERQEKAKQNQLQLTRKYRIGELPDIKIMYKDIIDPMIELAFYDEDMSGNLFTMLFLQIFQTEENQERKQKLLFILSGVMQKSKSYNFNFVTTIQKTMLQLTKQGQLFSSDVIRKAGLKSHAYHTSVLLLEESLFSKIYRQNTSQSILSSNNIGGQKKFIRGKKRQSLNKNTQQEEQSQKSYQIAVSDSMSYWMDLIDIYSFLSEQDQIKGVLTNVLNQEASEDTIQALDLKVEGQIESASKELQNIISLMEENNIDEMLNEIQDPETSQEALNKRDEIILYSRIKQYLQSERHECLQMLNQWEELSTDLTIQHKDTLQDPEKLGVTNMRQLLNTFLHQKDNQIEILNELCKKWYQYPVGKQILEGPLAYEQSLILIASKDIDRARYFHKLSKDFFLKVWPNYGAFASQSKHEFLQNLQKNHELKEFLDLDRKITISENECIQLFNNWSNRKPSYSHDSLMCWDQILNGRDLYSQSLIDRFYLQESIVNSNRSQWYVQNAKGMIKKGIAGAADPKMKIAGKLRKTNDQSSFNWEFYQVTAKLKLKQLAVNIQNISLQDNNKDPVQPFRNLCMIFDNQRQKYSQQLDKISFLKFNFLNIHVLEKFIDCYNNNFLIKEVDSDKLNKYADVLDEIFQNYQVILESKEFLQNIDLKNAIKSMGGNAMGQQLLLEHKYNQNEELVMLRKKEYHRFAQFSEKFLRILEGESVSELRNILLNVYDIKIEHIANMFVTYTIKSFQLLGGINEVYQEREIESISQSFNEELSQKDKEKITKTVNANTEIDKNLASLVIKMLQIIQRFPDTLGPIFKEAIEAETIPSWVFITFIPQLMHVLNNESACQYFSPLMDKISEKYSQSLIYQFNIIFPDLESCKTETSQKIFKHFHENYSEQYNFISALNCLTHPEHRLIYQLDQLKDCINSLQGSKQSKDQIQQQINLQAKRFKEDIFEIKEQGKYNDKFCKDYLKKLRDKFILLESFAYKSQAIQEKLMMDLENLKKQVKDSTNLIGDGEGQLSYYSLYLANFQQDVKIEIPGQYGQTSNSSMQGGGLQEPQADQHTYISSFDNSILTLRSIRKPKRIIVYGSDEKSYMFLVKGIEDLRLDQRIEQLYSVMNNIFIGEPDSRKRELYLSTFQIIPMTKSLGILEWVDQTKVLKQILEKELIEQTQQSIMDNDAYDHRLEFLNTINEKQNQHQLIKKLLNSKDPKQKKKELSTIEKHLQLLMCDSDTIVKSYDETVSLLPVDLLRNALQRLSMNSEAYLYLKNRFIRNYAVLCIAGYILGIGDRHLENYLINYKTGEIISIDFGLSFGEGLNLYLPELMPFRLTNCFKSIMNPIGVNGLFRHAMISAMATLKKRRHLLLDYCEVFIKDPILDWQTISKKTKNQYEFLQSQNQSSNANTQMSQYEDEVSSQWTAISKGQEVKINNTKEAQGKMQVVKFKLLGLKSDKIMMDELKDTRHSKYFYQENLQNVLKGRPGTYRSTIDQDFLEVEEQVDCLIDHSQDSDILGRSWIGWNPYI